MTDQEYFTVHHSMTVNVELLPDDAHLPSLERFESEIPTPFVVASEFSHLDQLADSARGELKNSELKHVIQLLDAQNAKLNLLLSFMLSQQDNPQHRFKTTRFGASLFTYLTSQMPTQGQRARVKLFIESPAAAIYCYALVSEIQPQQHDQWEVTMRYELLRDTDQDLLIKAALHQQQKLLRQRSIERENKSL